MQSKWPLSAYTLISFNGAIVFASGVYAALTGDPYLGRLGVVLGSVMIVFSEWFRWRSRRP